MRSFKLSKMGCKWPYCPRFSLFFDRSYSYALQKSRHLATIISIFRFNPKTLNHLNMF